jgi:hypothetical protein
MDLRPGQKLVVPLHEGHLPQPARVVYTFPAGVLLVDDDGKAAFVSHTRIESCASLIEDGNSESIPTLK